MATAKKQSAPKRTSTAPAQAVQRIAAWSYSRYSTWRQCPLLAKLKFVDKLKEPDNKHQAKGTRVHDLAEKFVKGEIAGVPEELALFSKQLTALKRAGAKAEQSIAFTKDWRLTGWFDADAWVRIKTDATLVKGKKARVVDYKTGKRYEPDHDEQLELYAAAVFLVYPEVETVSAEDWYIDSGKTEALEFTRGMLPGLLEKWQGIVRPMMADGRFEPKPSDKCRWCHFRKNNGGPCRY